LFDFEIDAINGGHSLESFIKILDS